MLSRSRQNLQRCTQGPSGAEAEMPAMNGRVPGPLPRCWSLRPQATCHRPLASAQAQVFGMTVRIDTDDLQLALSEFPVAVVRAQIDCRRLMLMHFRNEVQRGFGRKSCQTLNVILSAEPWLAAWCTAGKQKHPHLLLLRVDLRGADVTGLVPTSRALALPDADGALLS